MLYIKNNKVFNCKKEGNPDICNNMGGSDIMLSEISQTKKDKHYMILHICGIFTKTNKQTNKTPLGNRDSRMVAARNWGLGKWGAVV